MVGEPPHNSSAAVDAYAKAWDVNSGPKLRSETVPFADPRTPADAWRERLASRNNRVLLALAAQPPLRIGSPLTVHLWYLDQVVKVGRGGLVPLDMPARNATVAMHSQSLHFQIRFGGGHAVRQRPLPRGASRLPAPAAVIRGQQAQHNGQKLGRRLADDPWLLRAFERFSLRGS